MGHEHEARPGARAGKRHDEAAPLGRLADDLALQAVPAEVVVEKGGDRAFVTRRVARVDADQGAEQRRRLALDARDELGVDAGDIHGGWPPRLPPATKPATHHIGDDEPVHPPLSGARTVRYSEPPGGEVAEWLKAAAC